MTTPSPPEGFHPDDIWYVVSDALDAFEPKLNSAKPWEAYDGPDDDPKLRPEGYATLVHLAQAYAIDRLDRSAPKARELIDGPMPSGGVTCPLCALPMSLGPRENADENTGMVWVCDGPNDGTTLSGCGHTIPERDAPEGAMHYTGYTNANHLEAHLLDAHRHSLSSVPYDMRTLAWVRERHAELHRDGQTRFPHTHDPIDLPKLTGAIDAGLLGR